MTTKVHHSIDDLYHVEGKAELVNGEIIEMPPTGDDPGYAEDEVFFSLRLHEKRTKKGRAVADNKGFAVNLPHRKFLCPDAAFHNLPRTGMKFLQGAPLFAVEVRSENDYGPSQEKAILKKIADYFAAGTLIIWDVDLLNPDVIKSYRFDDSNNPTIYRRGDIANAEPAVPGWTIKVDDLFYKE